jgi:hypothetical protein
MNEYEFMRHTLATLAFRLRKALVGAPSGFADFTPGEGARTSLRMLRHLSSSMTWTISFFGGENATPEEVSWSEELARLEAKMIEFDALLIEGVQPTELTMAQIIQGPISDAMTHAGQLALYRRLASSPIPGENFTKADIAAGQLSLS